MQVSGANDYRLQDQGLESILAAPSTASSSHAKQGTVKQVQQGLMLVGPNSSAQLEAVWRTTADSLQSQVHQPEQNRFGENVANSIASSSPHLLDTFLQQTVPCNLMAR